MADKSRQRSFEPALVIAGSFLLWLGASAARAQCTGCFNASFGPAAQTYRIDSGAVRDSASADFDQDGTVDLAVATEVSFEGRINVFLAVTPARFTFPTVYVTHVRPSAMRASDFTGDGLTDLIFSGNEFEPGLFLMRGGPLGTFQPPENVAPGVHAILLATGDFDGDGRVDVARTSSAFSAGEVHFHFGTGTGGFSLPVSVPAGPNVRSLTAGDFNGDSRTDIVTTNGGGNTITVIAGVAQPPFAPGANIVIGNGPFAAEAADLNSDGMTDLAIASHQHRLSLLLATGPGSFSSPIHIAAGPGLISAGDFNGDFETDLAIIGLGELSVLTGDGSGSFAVSTLTGWIGAPRAEDFTGDGIDDLAILNHSGSFPFDQESQVSLLAGSVSGLRAPPTTAVGSPAAGLASGHVNGDANPDIAAFSFSAVQVGLGTGTGTFVMGSPLHVGTFVRDVQMADVNGDSHADLAVLENDRVTIHHGNGAGGFAPGAILLVSSGSGGLALADLDRNGHPDVLASSSSGNSLSVFLGTGGGAFQGGNKFAIGPQPGEIVAARFDSDPDPDVAVMTASGIAVLLGNGQGGFRSIQIHPLEQNARSPALGDFDGSGTMDIALLVTNMFHPHNPRLQVWHGDGAGGFALGYDVPLFSFPHALEASDLNQDGLPDLFLSDGSAGNVFLNAGAGVFGLNVRYWIGSPAFGSAVGDFIPDGLPDLAVSGESSRTVVVLPNTNCRPRTLRLEQAPSACVSPGVAFAAQPLLHVQDDGGNTVTCDSGLVNAALVPGVGAPLAVLGGTAAVAAAEGVASFTNLFLDREGAGYRIEFTHPGGGSVRSRPISTNPSVLFTIPPLVCPYSTGNIASVPDAGPGATYTWSIFNGVITSGAGTRAVTFRAGPSHRVFLSLTVLTEDGCTASTGRDVTISPNTCTPPLSFFTVPPCRLLDTREPAGPDGGPALMPGAPRTLIAAGRCGVPSTAKALSLNVTVTAASDPGHVTLYPAETPPPTTSVINYRAGQTRANNAILSLGAGANLTAECAQPGGTVHLILDVTGYFE